MSGKRVSRVSLGRVFLCISLVLLAICLCWAPAMANGEKQQVSVTVSFTVSPVNDPPVANDDSATMEEDTAVDIGVVFNDVDPDGAIDPATVLIIAPPTDGAVVVNPDGTVTYTADPGFSGTDTFTYTVEDDEGLTSNVATVTVSTVQEGVAGEGGVVENTCEEKVIINEVAWAGTAADPWGEWIELRNLGTIPVDLTGWILRWRRKHPSTPEDYRWKVLELSGMLMATTTSACELVDREPTPSVRIVHSDTDEISWLVLGEPEEKDGSYYLLERWHDPTVSNVAADLVYDTSPPYDMELSDLGDVIELLNARGEVVDTANAYDLEEDGWSAGSATTFATMERTDPLGPDTKENWHTNLGIITRGLDALERPLVATAGEQNSIVLDELALFANVQPAQTHAGTRLEVGLELSKEDRKARGWPWIRVTRPDLAEPAGGGGAVELAADYSFSGRYAHGVYWLGIDTGGLPPGRYNFWIVYEEGKTVLVPILVLP